jgi:hypothetical protein
MWVKSRVKIIWLSVWIVRIEEWVEDAHSGINGAVFGRKISDPMDIAIHNGLAETHRETAYTTQSVADIIHKS